ncbi:hypothetical protein GIB67_003860 [Kingdonia uniflora]|uniref:Uncharacterized protein n=1 Tax=Kingdonia uniflora TaxID=39325 RepID=A0A7J7NZ10_9MAGN|nr:hypothetical protein GIB67_003860 [Kingdonia uniflora]
MVTVVDDKFKKLEGEKNQFEENLTREREAFQLELEKERETAALKLKEDRAESIAEAERLVTASATSRNNLAGKLYQLRYTKAEILAFSEGNYEEKEIMNEEEVEEMEDGLNVVEKTASDNQETLDQEIKSLRLRVVELEGLLDVEKKSSTELQKELDNAREREEYTLLYNTEYAEEYEALISQYEDWLDDNVKLSLKLKEAKSEVVVMTATILSRDLALNQLTNELVELKEKVVLGKDLELHDSAQIRDSLIARLDRLKAYLHYLKGREAQSRADLAEVQAKNKSLVDDLVHAQGNVRRVVQRDKEMNERINQLCAQISELERKLRVCELKYEKDLKFEIDKRMKSIDLTKQMSERIDQLTAELAELKACPLRDNKCVVVTHQSLKELVVHEQEKCDGEALHQWQLSALVAFF